MDIPTSSDRRSDMEETGTNNTKVSDSAYSNSCSNSQSQRSGSSKSRLSISSGSSGYCGHPSTASSSNKAFPQPSSLTKRNKDHKKKKSKTATNNGCSNNTRTVNEHINDNDNITKTSTTDNPVDNALSNNNAPPIADPVLQFNNISIPTKDSEALQIAVLTQTFSCIKKLKSKDILPDENEVGNAHVVNIDDSQQQQIINSLKTDASHESEFCVVVSMQDGIVLYTTPSIKDVLGFPVDMWVGRSLIDFVHPKDRIAFASNISTGISNPQLEYNTKHGSAEETSAKCHSFFCCLRRYRGLNMNGFGVTEKKVSYLPCQLTTRFKEVKFNHQSNSPPCVFLVVTAQAASSAYKFSDETKMTPKFMTQHSSTSHLTHVDPDVVPYFGFLPQDMIGRSVFDFYHPEDLVYIKEVYEAVMKEQGQPVCSKPYRFRCQNGCYVLLETEWSNFINPWTRKLMFVIGQHRVLKGPSNPDVLTPVEVEEPLEISEEVLKESKAIQEQIQILLSETVARNNTENGKRQVSTCCKDLASFMETLMDEFTKPPDLKLDLANEVQCVSDRDSVMLGEISPHSDYYESKYSSETPPSYNQLNYNENIQRFFESKPKTSLSVGSQENKNNTNLSSMSGGDEEEKIPTAVNFSSTSHNNRLCMIRLGNFEQNEKSQLSDCHFVKKNEHGVNGHSSGSGLSSASAGNLESQESRGETSATDMSNTSSYRPLHLTEALLCKHNEDMEKQMIKRHREQRGKPDRRGKHKEGRHKGGFVKIQEEQRCHGVKRSGSHSWEGEPFKSIKQTHGNVLNTTEVAGEQSQCTQNAMYNAQHIPNTVPQSSHTVYPLPPVNQWPPFSAIVTPLHPAQSCSTHVNFTTPLVNPMMPVYYVEPMTTSNINGSTLHYRMPNPSEHQGPPNLQQPTQNLQQNTFIRHQVQYSSNMMYQPLGIPLFAPQTIVYTPSAEIPAETQMMEPAHIPRNSRPIPSNNNSQQTSTGKQAVQVFRPSSQATSVKVEPGSALCSVASASLKQAMSESSKKAGKSICSPVGITSCTISSTEKHKESQIETDTYSYDVDGSYNSLYSFLKTEPSNASMKSSTNNDHHSPPLMEPLLLRNVLLNPELVFRYKISDSRPIEEILNRDKEILTTFHQPCMVNEQLRQLYLDLSTDLSLEEGSGSSGEDNVTSASTQKLKQKKKKFLGYDRMAMIFEESAPLPPPDNVSYT